MTRQSATPTAGTPSGLVERFLENVRLVKHLRKLDDEALAQAGGYRSRQVLNARLAGRTKPDIDDIARICAGLRVDPEVIFLPTKELYDWVVSPAGQAYKPPRQPKPSRTRTNRSATNAPSDK
jgi:transcriptional regulator with XRE-family HTH domain